MAKPPETRSQEEVSTVTALLVDGRRCVRKRYYQNGDAKDKFQREVSFYNYYAGLDCLPRLIEARFPDEIIMEQLEGEPLSSWWAGKLLSALEPISRCHGENIGRFLSQEPDSEMRHKLSARFPEPASFKVMAAQTLEAVDAKFRSEARFDRPIMHAAVACAGEVLQSTGYWGEECLCKLDWNAVNTIIRDGRIAGYVDFARAFPGTRQIFIGTIIDHIDVLDWPRVKAGITARCGSFPSPREQMAGAFFSTCYKIISACKEGRIGSFTPERLVLKFEQMTRMIERSA